MTELKTEIELEEIIKQTNELKKTGNQNFNSKRWQIALNQYSEALSILPLHLNDLQLKETETEIEIETETETKSNDDTINLNQKENLTPQDPRISQLRSILHANTAACFLKLEDWQSAIQACGNSLKDNPNYVKALHRRAQANEKIGTWASLQASLDDYNKMSEMNEEELNEILRQEIAAAKRRLPQLIEEKSQIDKAEMMNKLKDLGNSVLGKFGLSTDNFKFTPNQSGGYSMSFQQ